MQSVPEARFFPNRAAFRKWLHANHAGLDEQWVGFYKKASGKRALTYDEAVDESLCFGWIDGTIRRIDEETYMHRFTPRKRTSNWSAVNLKKFAALSRSGLVAAPGREAFDRRDKSRDASYSYERKMARFEKSQLAQFKEDRSAWRHWEDQPPGYRRTVTYWVVSAKRPETRQRRLVKLIEASASGTRLSQFS